MNGVVVKNSALIVKNLKKEFQTKKGEFLAVKGVSLTINAGEIVALLGPNGAGKTTCVQIMAGILLPTSGDIYLNGEKLTNNNRKNFKIGLVLGGDLGFYGNASAYHNLVFFANLNKIKRSDIKSEIHRVLKDVDLFEQAEQKVNTFSRGMKQRLHIARALLGAPDLLLLDEPTTGLDVEIARDIRNLIKELAVREQIPVLLTSHMMSEIEYLADEILLIGAGSIYHKGDMESIAKLAQSMGAEAGLSLEEAYLAIAPKLKRL